jgi:hypothetical protein
MFLFQYRKKVVRNGSKSISKQGIGWAQDFVK